MKKQIQMNLKEQTAYFHGLQNGESGEKRLNKKIFGSLK